VCNQGLVRSSVECHLLSKCSSVFVRSKGLHRASVCAVLIALCDRQCDRLCDRLCDRQCNRQCQSGLLWHCTHVDSCLNMSTPNHSGAVCEIANPAVEQTILALSTTHQSGSTPPGGPEKSGVSTVGMAGG
jgi:hypothetical protein